MYFEFSTLKLTKKYAVKNLLGVRMRMKNLKVNPLQVLTKAVTGAVLSLVVLLAFANSSEAHDCGGGVHSDEYVQNALMICLADLPSRRAQCMRDAEAAFEQCRFPGNFSRISNRLQAKIIMLSLFKNFVAPPVAQMRASKDTKGAL